VRRATIVVLALACTLPVTACRVSIGAEDELGDRYAEALVRQLPVLDDPQVVTPLLTLANQLVVVADEASRDWHFYVVDDSAVNAFAVPGGHVFVYRGLIERAGSASELAGVLGHELAHVTLRHSVDQLTARTRMNALVSIVCSVFGMCGSTVAQVAINVGGEAMFASHSRDDERQADSAAVEYLLAAGIDPRGIPEMFRRLAEERGRNPGALEAWFTTHPSEEDRIALTSAWIGRHPATQLDGLRRHERAFENLQESLRRRAGGGT
jgi:predicted Zn-dependent protease